ncbi:MAG: LTA synthase family protein, partial [Paramuribaculum sp.]|nr:LTA synthase family protein [Paramuribaculum sp.]
MTPTCNNTDYKCSAARWVFPIAIFITLILFDVIWCSTTTFAPFSFTELYGSAIVIAMLLSLPGLVRGMWKTETVIMLLLDILLVVNLMYSRSYYTSIPLSSYGLAANLADFTSSVTDSLRWIDILFPVTTIAAIWLFLTLRHRVQSHANNLRIALIVSVVGLLLLFAPMAWRGGFINSYNNLRKQAY